MSLEGELRDKIETFFIDFKKLVKSFKKEIDILTDARIKEKRKNTKIHYVCGKDKKLPKNFYKTFTYKENNKWIKKNIYHKFLRLSVDGKGEVKIENK